MKATEKFPVPKDLKAAGKALWTSICDQADTIEGTEPMLAELCRLCDRLAEIRARIAKDGLMPGGKKHPLIAEESRISTQYQRVWRTLGLAEAEPEPARGKGRPLGR